MIDEKRIEQAKKNLARFLEDGLIKKKKDDIAKVKYIENTDLSLRIAD